MVKKLGEILIEDGRLTEAQLQKALKAQLIFGGHLGTSLIELGYIDEEMLGETLSRAFNVPYATYEILENVPYSVIRAVPAKLVEKYKVIPLRIDGKVLQLAMLDPKNLMALDEISFVTGYKIDPWVAPEIRIFQVLEKYYNIPRSQRYVSLAREMSRLRARAGGELHDGADPDRGLAAGASAASADEEAADPNVETEPVARQAPPPPAPRAEPARGDAPSPARPMLDHWEKYGYGRSWREYADAMERSPAGAAAPSATLAEPADTAPQTLPVTPREEPLMEVSRRLAACVTPDEVAEVVLAFASRHLERAALFVVRGDVAIGWGGAGERFATARVRGLNVPLVRDSIVALVDESRSHYLGPVPPFPSIRRFYQDLGTPMPRIAFLLPIRIRERNASILYADGDADDDLRTLDVDLFLRLAAKASLALQMIIFRNKILQP